MIVINNQYEIGDEVYLKTDSDQLKRIVVSIKVYKNGELLYELISGTTQSLHYDFEISETKDLVNAI